MDYREFLMHHGVKDQKWGVKNGPPYPLNMKKSTYKKVMARAKKDDSPKTKSSGSSSGQNPKMEKKSTVDKAFTKSVKVGKDKSPISPAESMLKETGKIVDDTSKIFDTVSRMKKPKRSYDLSKMSDRELRDAVNRMNLERSYISMMESKHVSRGAEYTKNILAITGGVVGITGSTVGIISAIKNLT